MVNNKGFELIKCCKGKEGQKVMTLYQLENHVANRNQQNCSAKVKENAVQYIQSTIKTDIEEERDTKEIIKYSKVFVKFMCAHCNHSGKRERGTVHTIDNKDRNGGRKRY